jgi:hypothetical protein
MKRLAIAPGVPVTVGLVVASAWTVGALALAGLAVGAGYYPMAGRYLGAAAVGAWVFWKVYRIGMRKVPES